MRKDIEGMIYDLLGELWQWPTNHGLKFLRVSLDT